jgi:Zn-finger nucleic acid-binding protein
MCPYCEAMLQNVVIRDVTVMAIGGNQWRGIVYLCPSCNKSLSVAIDPVALRHDIVDDLFARLRGK